jgi:uncharacterized integral membrane protein
MYEEKVKEKMNKSMFVNIFLLFLVGIFAIYNQETVELFGAVKLPLFIVVVIFGLNGYVAGLLKMMHYKKETQKLKSAIKTLNDNVDGIVSSELAELANRYRNYDPNLDMD